MNLSWMLFHLTQINLAFLWKGKKFMIFLNNTMTLTYFHMTIKWLSACLLINQTKVFFVLIFVFHLFSVDCLASCTMKIFLFVFFYFIFTLSPTKIKQNTFWIQKKNKQYRWFKWISLICIFNVFLRHLVDSVQHKITNIIL